MSERASDRWPAPPRGPRLAFDNDTSVTRASTQPAAATDPVNHDRDRDIIDRLAAELERGAALSSNGRAREPVTPQNEDRDFIDGLITELNNARARIEELESEADERLHQARIQIRAEIGAALGRLQDEADANLEDAKREADERAERRIAVAESRIRRLEAELVAAKDANEWSKADAAAQVENLKSQVNARAREHAETERRLARVQAEVVQSHTIALQARTDAAALVERTQRETAERIAHATADFDTQLARLQGELHHYKTRVPDADARVVKVKEQAEQRIARIQARANERLAQAQAEADERVSHAQAEADERLVRASTEIQQTFTRLETELASARQQTEQTRATAEALVEKMLRERDDYIAREVSKRAREAKADLERHYVQVISDAQEQVARLEEALTVAQQRAEHAEHWLARIRQQVEGQLAPRLAPRPGRP
jgi:hypothetical protein